MDIINKRFPRINLNGRHIGKLNIPALDKTKQLTFTGISSKLSPIKNKELYDVYDLSEFKNTNIKLYFTVIKIEKITFCRNQIGKNPLYFCASNEYTDEIIIFSKIENHELIELGDYYYNIPSKEVVVTLPSCLSYHLNDNNFFFMVLTKEKTLITSKIMVRSIKYKYILEENNNEIDIKDYENIYYQNILKIIKNDLYLPTIDDDPLDHNFLNNDSENIENILSYKKIKYDTDEYFDFNEFLV